MQITLVTPEVAPLAVFGRVASQAVAAELAQAGVGFHGSAHTEIDPGHAVTVVIHPGARRIEVDRVVALPRLRGRAPDGVVGSTHHGGGAEARQALDLAGGLARACGAALVVRSIVESALAEAEARAYDHDWLAGVKATAERELRKALADAGVEAEGTVVAGLPVRELVALSGDVDVLVVGSRAWGPVRRILMGSTAAHLMRESQCPVLVLPRGAATGQPGEREPAVAGAQPRASSSSPRSRA